MRIQFVILLIIGLVTGCHSSSDTAKGAQRAIEWAEREIDPSKFEVWCKSALASENGGQNLNTLAQSFWRSPTNEHPNVEVIGFETGERAVCVFLSKGVDTYGIAFARTNTVFPQGYFVYLWRPEIYYFSARVR
jgi:hypothetical protein